MFKKFLGFIIFFALFIGNFKIVSAALQNPNFEEDMPLAPSYKPKSTQKNQVIQSSSKLKSFKNWIKDNPKKFALITIGTATAIALIAFGTHKYVNKTKSKIKESTHTEKPKVQQEIQGASTTTQTSTKIEQATKPEISISQEEASIEAEKSKKEIEKIDEAIAELNKKTYVDSQYLGEDTVLTLARKTYDSLNINILELKKNLLQKKSLNDEEKDILNNINSYQNGNESELISIQSYIQKQENELH